MYNNRIMNIFRGRGFKMDVYILMPKYLSFLFVIANKLFEFKVASFQKIQYYKHIFLSLVTISGFLMRYNIGVIFFNFPFGKYMILGLLGIGLFVLKNVIKKSR